MIQSDRYVVGLTGDAVHPNGLTDHGDINLERLREAGLHWTVLPHPDEESFIEALSTVDAVISFGHAPFGEKEYEACPRLKHVARFGAGYETVDLAASTGHGVVVTNTPEAVRRPLALAGLTMLLALSHQLLFKDRLVREGRWAERGKHRGTGLAGQTLGILGFGSVGAELAELAKPLGLHLVGNNRSGQSSEAERIGVPLVSKEQLAAEADFVVVIAALTPESHHMVDWNFFRLMKTSAYLINIGRGALVDQQAMYRALAEGEIAGAGLDVFEPEPIDTSDPLLRMENVILTPHSLCWTRDFTEAVSKSVFEAIISISKNCRPKTLINSQVWESPERRAARQ